MQITKEHQKDLSSFPQLSRVVIQGKIISIVLKEIFVTESENSMLLRIRIECSSPFRKVRDKKQKDLFVDKVCLLEAFATGDIADSLRVYSESDYKGKTINISGSLRQIHLPRRIVNRDARKRLATLIGEDYKSEKIENILSLLKIRKESRNSLDMYNAITNKLPFSLKKNIYGNDFPVIEDCVINIAKSMITNDETMVNSVTLQGIIAHPPDKKTLQGIPFKVAINNDYTGRADIVRCIWNPKDLEDTKKILVKGMPVMIHGSLEHISYDNNRSISNDEIENIAKLLGLNIHDPIIQSPDGVLSILGLKKDVKKKVYRIYREVYVDKITNNIQEFSLE